MGESPYHAFRLRYQQLPLRLCLYTVGPQRGKDTGGPLRVVNVPRLTIVIKKLFWISKCPDVLEISVSPQTSSTVVSSATSSSQTLMPRPKLPVSSEGHSGTFDVFLVAISSSPYPLEGSAECGPLHTRWPDPNTRVGRGFVEGPQVHGGLSTDRAVAIS